MVQSADNASLLIEEALLYMDYNIRMGIMTEREYQRLIDKNLLRGCFYEERVKTI